MQSLLSHVQTLPNGELRKVIGRVVVTFSLGGYASAGLFRKPHLSTNRRKKRRKTFPGAACRVACCTVGAS